MSHRGDHGPRGADPIQRFMRASRANSADLATRSARAASACMIRKFAVSWTCHWPAAAGGAWAWVGVGEESFSGRVGSGFAAGVSFEASRTLPGAMASAGSSGADPRTTTLSGFLVDLLARRFVGRSAARLRRYSPYQLFGLNSLILAISASILAHSSGEVGLALIRRTTSTQRQ